MMLEQICIIEPMLAVRKHLTEYHTSTDLQTNVADVAAIF